MKIKKVLAAAAAAAVAGSASMIPAAAAEGTTKPIEAWTSDFNVEVTADSGSSGTYQTKYGNTIFGKVRAAGKNDTTAENAGLDLRMTPSSGTSGISKADSGYLYLVKIQSPANSTDYALGVLGTDAVLESDDGIALSEGDTFSLSYDTYAVKSNSNWAKNTTVTLKDKSGSDLISYTYTPYNEGLITDVKFRGGTVSEFVSQSAHSWKTDNTSLTTIAELSTDDSDEHKNAHITFTVKADGTASLNIIRDSAGSAEAVNKTYNGTVGVNATIGSFTISNGKEEDGSRVYTIDNLVTTVTSEPTEPENPEIKPAEEYRDAGSEDQSVKGFKAEIEHNGTIGDFTWYLKKDNDSEYKLAKKVNTVVTTEGTALFGLVLYDIPENSKDYVTAGYSYKTTETTVE